MADSLFARGPDDGGTWVDAAAGLALGHRRLAVLDLSPAGHQPMVSQSGRYVLVFGGEIYNFTDLRTELERTSRSWRGHSDTEVMLAAFDAWGIESATRRFNGMFAFAVWDREERTLHLGRDRLGEKPLYYGWMGQSFLFASELKALHLHPAFQGRLDRGALWLYLRYGFVPGPHSIYEGIQKLPPGNLVSIHARDSSSPVPTSYWSMQSVLETALRNPRDASPREAGAALHELLRDAVRMRLASDVPLGALLSGGIDSSTVVALMQAQSMHPVRTFTIGFEEASYDEAPSARAVARILGTEHTELYVTAQQALEVIPLLPQVYDEPFADSSQIPTYLLSRLARQHVTVGLSGDGGDEVFGGYTRHVLGPRIWSCIGWLPPGVRRLAGRLLTAIPLSRWDVLARMLPQCFRPTHLGEKMHKASSVLAIDGADDLYMCFVAACADPSALLRDGARRHAQEPPTSHPLLRSMSEQMMYRDSITYLPDDILVKVDRASMAMSLEVRAPFLDPRVVEFAWALPLSYRIRHGSGKWLLRQILHTRVPKRLVERPKAGFGVPLSAWLRGPLRPWAEQMLDTASLRREGLFDPASIRRHWDEHVHGRRDWGFMLWTVLMFSAWLEQKTLRHAL